MVMALLSPLLRQHKRDVFHLKMIRGWRGRRGKARIKKGGDDGLMEWMSNCVDESV